jgi:hypothetical protein
VSTFTTIAGKSEGLPKEDKMEILGILGQYLLMAFVLPGFCYVLVFALCFPDFVDDIRGKSRGSKVGSEGLWMSFFVIAGGMLLSSVAFAIEIMLRFFEIFDCEWFLTIPFQFLKENTLANFFTAETFAHFNTAVGVLVILLIYWKFGDKSRIPGPWLVPGLAFLVAANLLVSSHLFARVATVALVTPESSKAFDDWRNTCRQRHHYTVKPETTPNSDSAGRRS